MPDTRNLDFLLQFKTQDAKKAEKDIKGVAQASANLEASQSSIASTAKKVNDSLGELSRRQTQINALVKRFQEAANAGDDTAGAAEVAGRALVRLGATQNEIQAVTKELALSTQQALDLNKAVSAIGQNEAFGAVSQRVALSGDVESQVRTIGGAFGTFGGGGIERAGQGAGEIFAVIEAAPRLKAAFEGMPQVLKATYQEIGASGAGLIGALVVLTATMAYARKEFQDAAKETRAVIDAQKSAFDLIRTGSEEEILAKRDELKRKLELEREYLTAVQAQYEKGISASQDKIGGLLTDVIEFSSANIGIGSGALAEYNKQIEDQANLVKGLETEFKALDNALNSTNFSTNALSEAELELARIRTGSAIQYATERARLEIELQQEITDKNKEAIDERIDNFNKELEILQRANDSLALTKGFAQGDENKKAIQDEIDANAIRITQLQDFISIANEASQAINTNANSLREFANIARDAGKETRSLRDLVGDIQKSTQETLKQNADIASIAQKGADKIADIRRGLAQKEADLLLQLSQSLRDARAKANQAIEDADRKHSDALLDLEQDYADQRAKIIRDANRDMNRAIADRDVSAFVAAKQNRNEQLDDAKSGYDQQRRELQISYERQLRDIQINLQRQESELRIRYQRQLEATRQAAQASIQLEQQRIQNEIRLKQQGYQAMLQAEQSFVQAQIAGMQGLVNAATGLLGNLSGAVAQAQNIATNATNGALNILNSGGFNQPVNVLGGSNSSTINMQNNFASGTNQQQIVNSIMGQLANILQG